jgi:hypothetical protein
MVTMPVVVDAPEVLAEAEVDEESNDIATGEYGLVLAVTVALTLLPVVDADGGRAGAPRTNEIIHNSHGSMAAARIRF